MNLKNIKTYFRLGIGNVISVVIFRILKKYGFYRRMLKRKTMAAEAFLASDALVDDGEIDIEYFGYHIMTVSSPPNWFLNPWNNYGFKQNDLHWSEIPDFMPKLGDIKTVWELSRFDWLPKMAWQYRMGDTKALARLETWLRDWVQENPLNSGINWKCGQEASLRALNLLVAAQIIGEPFLNPSPGMLMFLEQHMLRVMPTIRYAVAQDNNHGTSEATALFVVGYYLTKHGNASQKKRGRKWLRRGRFWIENRVARLILGDGSFSQHSVTYHRLMLDSISYLELIRQYFGLPEFSTVFYKKMALAVLWLRNMMDVESGDAPNIGANDGAYIFNFDAQPYRDFRPSVELGAVIFLKKTVAQDGVYHPLLNLFKIDTENLDKLENPDSNLMTKGGYCRLNNSKGHAILRLPKYVFRPSHADGLHLDVWHNGENIVRDAGSFSYNTNKERMDYYSGTKSHSTIVFDNRNQMPHISRFLFSNWLEPTVLETNFDTKMVKAGYVDYLKSSHIRQVTANEKNNGWVIVDAVDGFKEEAVIYWRLVKRDWKLEGMVLKSDDIEINISTNITNIFLELVELPESRHYLHEEYIPVLKITTKESGKIRTTISFNS